MLVEEEEKEEERCVVCVCVINIEGRQRLVKVGGGGILLLWGFSVCRTAIVRIDPVAFYH